MSTPSHVTTPATAAQASASGPPGAQTAPAAPADSSTDAPRCVTFARAALAAALTVCIRQAPQPMGLVGPFFTALAVLLGLGRLHRALWMNHRYWFTTWRGGKWRRAMLLVGVALELSMAA